MAFKIARVYYEIRYKKGCANSVANALSWAPKGGELLALSTPNFPFFGNIAATYLDDPKIACIKENLEVDPDL